MPCITELYPLFYVDNLKVIPENLYNLLTPVTLAHLIMGDGSTQRYSLKIYKDSYTLSDIIRLMNVLIIRYELDCTLRFHTPTQPHIHIKQNSIQKLITIVGPYMYQTMMYKLDKTR
jgi:LAGLIDADG DNA endonuclease family